MVSDIPAGDGKLVEPFFTVYVILKFFNSIAKEFNYWTTDKQFKQIHRNTLSSSEKRGCWEAGLTWPRGRIVYLSLCNRSLEGGGTHPLPPPRKHISQDRMCNVNSFLSRIPIVSENKFTKFPRTLFCYCICTSFR